MELQTSPVVGVGEHAKIVAEAHKRFNLCVQWESTQRERGDFDEKFENGDAQNLYQWPDTIYASREIEDRPTLTINKTHQHCLQVINDGKQNKPGVNYRPTGGLATYEAAQTLQAVARAIEYKSNAEQAYDWAMEKQVKRGIGYVRVTTDYADDTSFDLDIYIRRVKDPKSIYLDPNIQEADGSDANYAFVFEDVDRDVFATEYPDHEDLLGRDALGGNVSGGWLQQNTIRVAEYFRRRLVKDELIVITTEAGDERPIRRSEVPAAILNKAIAEMKERGEQPRRRPLKTYKIDWYKIAGDKIIDEKPWPGMYIPIARCIGEETLFDGTWDCKGLVRWMIDSQRMYNYNASAAVEYGALQTKTPYKAPVEAIAGYETYWEKANVANFSVLPYRAVSVGGQLLPTPEREPPPMAAQAYMAGMETAERQMMMSSGQYEANFGMKGNERSGVAINERQRQGDNATFHYIDGQGIMIKYIGKIILDLIPKIYDTERLIRIKEEDGTEKAIQIDPAAQQPVQKSQTDEDGFDLIFNPTLGQYAVFADMGPSFATRRQEAFNAIMQLLQANAQLWMVFGDLFFQTSDFPLAEKMAERMRKVIPSNVTGDGPSPEVMALQEKVQSLTQALTSAMTDGAKEELEKARMRNDARADDVRVQIELYRAETDRLTAIADKVREDALAINQILSQLKADMQQTDPTGAAALASSAGDAGADTTDTSAASAMAPAAAPAAATMGAPA